VSRGFAIFLIAAFVSTLVFAYSQQKSGGGPPPLKVPNLEGQKVAAAKHEVDDDFKLARSRENSDQPEGTIIIQSPEPGTKAEQGESISVVVSDGPRMAKLPGVVGKAKDEAERDLSAAGFNVEVKTVESPEEGAGKVLEQSPSGGSEAKRGSEVAITIGIGPEPAPGYNIIQDPIGGLAVEVPPSWGVDTGADSEYPSGVASKDWSTYVGEDITSSITTAPSLNAWYDSDQPGAGAYLVASKTLAQNYSDDELIYSSLFSELANNCEQGPSNTFQGSSLSGEMQTWYNCRGLGITNFVVAAHPEGRKCVVVMLARIVNETDRETVQHMLDTFNVDCSRVS
jgi:hypothetical protein